jgi:undecaprenyl pyrophosphate synthase
MIPVILSQIWPYIAGAVAIIAGLFGWRQSIRRGVKAEAKAERAEATILAKKLREELDDEIQQEPDLVARARRIPGFVRPDSKP